MDDLRFYLAGAEKSLLDPAKEKYRQANTKLRDALTAELAKREQATPPAEPALAEYPPLNAANIAQQLALCGSGIKFAALMNAWQREKHLHSAGDLALVEQAKMAAQARLWGKEAAR
jgi:hypothetical protein